MAQPYSNVPDDFATTKASQVAWLTTVQRQLFHFPASHARAFT